MIRFEYRYNDRGRLTKIILSKNASESLCKTGYTVPHTKRRQLAGTSMSDCSYSYDVHGWLTNINSGGFQEQLYYADGLADQYYNGNISTIKWKAKDDISIQGYNLKYDKTNRLKSAVFGSGNNLTGHSNYFDESAEYDCNGNITRLKRCGLKDNMHGGFGLVDDLYMAYKGNMLTSVRDEASRYSYAGATDFDGVKGQEYPLTYNDAGSLVSDAGRKIARIDYDYLNNPIRIQFTNGNVTKYVYSATGEKLRVIYQTAVPNITVAIGSTKELASSEIQYTDSTDYLLGGALTLKNGRIDKFQFEEGYCQAEKYNATQDNFTFCYYDQDHLGNIRQVTKADGSTKGKIIQKMHYYPFGAQLCDGTTDSNVQSRKYNGKEYDRMHGLNTYDYGARQYNPVTARWDRVDPLAEKYYNISPYAYCANNPVKYVDPDGKKVVFVNGYLGFGSPKGGDTYWNGSNSFFVKRAQSTLNDNATPYFTNYDYNYIESASIVREALGYQYAKENYKELTKDMKPRVDKFNFVSHSMGGAFSEGMMKYLAEQNWETENSVFLNSWEPTHIYNKVEKTRIDATTTNDPVQFLSKPLFGEPDIPLSDDRIRIKSNESIMYIHRDLIDGNSDKLWNMINDFLSK